MAPLRPTNAAQLKVWLRVGDVCLITRWADGTQELVRVGLLEKDRFFTTILARDKNFLAALPSLAGIYCYEDFGIDHLPCREIERVPLEDLPLYMGFNIIAEREFSELLSGTEPKV